LKNFFSEKNYRKKGFNYSKPLKKFKKKISLSSISTWRNGSSKLIIGDIGFKAMNSCVFTSSQIDSIRRSLLPIRNVLNVWVKVKPCKFLTSKPLNSRMGKGKGKFKCVVGNILKNEIFLEFTPIDFWFYGSFIYSAISKFPVKVKLVFRKKNPHETYTTPAFDDAHVFI
jgi:large subunit ribosomal protein L16